MTALQKIVLGTPPAAVDGDPVRTASTKANANVDVLNTQMVLTSYPTTITASQNLTVADHLGKRVNLNFASAAAIGLPSASACPADSLILLRNLGTTVITVVVTGGSGDTVSLAVLNPGESVLYDTDGAHAWRALLRGRATTTNESVAGILTAAGIASTAGASIKGGTLTVYQADGVTAAATMAANGNVGCVGVLTGASLSISGVGSVAGAFSANAGMSVRGGGFALYQSDGSTAAATISQAGNIGCVGTLTGATLNISGVATVAGNLNVLGANIGGVAGLSVTGTYPFLTRAAAAAAGQYWCFGGDSSSSFAIRAGGPSGLGAFLAYNATSWAATSDGRLKNITAPLQDALAAVKSLQTVKFTWKDKKLGAAEHVGFIAQDVQSVLPECVTTDENGYLAIQYSELTVLLAAAIKEMSAKLDAAQQQIDALKALAA